VMQVVPLSDQKLPHDASWYLNRLVTAVTYNLQSQWVT